MERERGRGTVIVCDRKRYGEGGGERVFLNENV